MLAAGIQDISPLLWKRNVLFRFHMGPWHSSASRKVTGLILDAFIWFFHWLNLPGRSVVLGSARPLAEMSTSGISWRVTVVGVWGWQRYHFHVPIVKKSGTLNFVEPSGLVQGQGQYFILIYCRYCTINLIFVWDIIYMPAMKYDVSMELAFWVCVQKVCAIGLKNHIFNVCLLL